MDGDGRANGRDPHVPHRVDVEEPEAAAYWARRFRVPVELVQDAVRAIGEDPARVAVYLGVPWPDAGDVM